MKTEAKAQHTPGPWRISGKFPAPIWIRTGSKELEPYIAQVNAGRDEAEANARLIAAAPELLEACKAFVNGDMHDKDVFSKAIAAISKAEGGK